MTLPTGAAAEASVIAGLRNEGLEDTTNLRLLREPTHAGRHEPGRHYDGDVDARVDVTDVMRRKFLEISKCKIITNIIIIINNNK